MGRGELCKQSSYPAAAHLDISILTRSPMLQALFSSCACKQIECSETTSLAKALTPRGRVAVVEVLPTIADPVIGMALSSEAVLSSTFVNAQASAKPSTTVGPLQNPSRTWQCMNPRTNNACKAGAPLPSSLPTATALSDALLIFLDETLHVDNLPLRDKAIYLRNIVHCKHRTGPLCCAP